MPDFIDMPDFMAKSTVLRRHGRLRAFFDPRNKKHIASLKNYLSTGSWIQQFFPEDPFADVPMTVFRKYVGHLLGVNVTTTQKIVAAELLNNLTNLIRSQDELEAAEAVQREEGFQADIHEGPEE